MTIVVKLARDFVQEQFKNIFHFNRFKITRHGLTVVVSMDAI